MNTALEYLRENGYLLPDTTMYNYIDIWKSWFMNQVDFHTYRDFYGDQRQMYTLGMAKRLCEDWSSIIFTEKDEISTNKTKNKSFVEKFVSKTRLRKKLPIAIEKSAWSGTCGSIFRLKNIKVNNGIIEKTDKTDYDLILVSADHIIPLRIEHEKIIDVAFVSEKVVKGKTIICLEIHELKDNGYVITNVFIDEETKEEVNLDNIIKKMETQSDIPLFALLMPPTDNEIEDNLGLGLSVYANAIDQLKDCDIKYHNSVMDFYLGGKKLIYNKKLVKYKQITITKEDGTKEVKEIPVYPDDISKQQWMEIGDGLSDKELVQEINPSLRTTENKDGIQFSLDILSFKAMLGTKYYEFSGGSVVTATQYAGDRQDLMKNAKKYRNNLDEFISDIIKGALLLGRLVFNEKVDENCIVEVANRDGILVSDEELREQYRQEYNMGLMSKRTYLMKINNWAEEEALAELQRIEEENSIKEVSEE